MSVWSCACASATWLYSKQIIKKSRNEIIVKHFSSLLVDDNERENGDSFDHVTSQHEKIGIFLPRGEGFTEKEERGSLQIHCDEW